MNSYAIDTNTKGKPSFLGKLAQDHEKTSETIPACLTNAGNVQQGFNDMAMWRLKKVKDETGLSRSSIYELMKQDEFPKKIKLAPRIVAWDSSEIEAWIESRKAARQG